MPTPIRMLAICLVVLGVGGCSKTAVTLGEDGIVNAVTEAPTFRWRNTLIEETKEAVEKACSTIRDNMLVEFVPSRSNDGEENAGISDNKPSKHFKDLGTIFDFVENMIDIVPSHSVALAVKCKEKPNSQPKPENNSK